MDERQNNVVFIGKKDFGNYVNAVLLQFNTNKEVILKSRGKFTNKCIDVAESVNKRFLKGNVKIADIKIDSAEFENKEGKKLRVSTLEIMMERI